MRYCCLFWTILSILLLVNNSSDAGDKSTQPLAAEQAVQAAVTVASRPFPATAAKN
jgi:hypothetical protein